MQRGRSIGIVAGLLLATSMAIVGAPAQALSPACTMTPLVPYRSGSSVVYGNTLGCSQPIAQQVVAYEERQGTGTWANIDTAYSLSYAGTYTIPLTDTGPCSPGGTHTFRSKGFGGDQTGTGTAYSAGRSLTC